MFHAPCSMLHAACCIRCTCGCVMQAVRRSTTLHWTCPTRSTRRTSASRPVRRRLRRPRDASAACNRCTSVQRATCTVQHATYTVQLATCAVGAAQPRVCAKALGACASRHVRSALQSRPRRVAPSCKCPGSCCMLRVVLVAQSCTQLHRRGFRCVLSQWCCLALRGYTALYRPRPSARPSLSV
jgi:hypothetical protein